MSPTSSSHPHYPLNWKTAPRPNVVSSVLTNGTSSMSRLLQSASNNRMVYQSIPRWVWWIARIMDLEHSLILRPIHRTYDWWRDMNCIMRGGHLPEPNRRICAWCGLSHRSRQDLSHTAAFQLIKQMMLDALDKFDQQRLDAEADAYRNL